jgi:ABC-type ATPase with predicted acetyltransferase domain
MTAVTINQNFRAVTAARADEPPSEAVLKTAEMFGIGLDETYEVTLYAGLRLDVRPGDVISVTGPSGGGKSVLLARLGEALAAAWPETPQVDLAAVALPADRRVIDLVRPPLERALRTLSTAGLADAFLLLRTPQELSDGQRYRLRLALAIEKCGVQNDECRVNNQDEGRNPAQAVSGSLCTHHSSLITHHSSVLLADEFCSTLDRLCARAVAYRVRRMASREGVTVLAASAHDDLLEDLAPDVLVIKHEGSRVEVVYADAARGEERP